LVIAAFYAENYQQCSRAFVKLKSKIKFQILKDLTTVSDDERKVYESYAAKIFIKNPPVAPNQVQTYECPGKTCKAIVDEFEINCRVFFF